jgi:hypothetical protein
METIKTQIQNNLSKKRDEIISLCISSVVKIHNGMTKDRKLICNCEYCVANKKYVDYKISESRRIIYQANMYGLKDYDINYYQMKIFCHHFKNKRDTLKQITLK